MKQPLFHTFISTLLILLLSACSKVQYVDELLTLKRVANEQEAMAQDVEATDKLFEKLVSAVKDGRLSTENTRDSILKLYGKPILVDNQMTEGQKKEMWLYRYATEFFGSDKVYLTFDSSGTLKEWKLLEGGS